MRKFTLKRPDGTETVLDQDGLVIGYNRGNIDVSWLARPEGSQEWERVGVLIGVEASAKPQGPTSQTTEQDQATTRESQKQWRFGVVGFLVGALLAFLLRPSVPLVGQLPFVTVITRGSSLQGLDQLLVPAACTAFNYMLGGAIAGAIAGFAGARLTAKK